jgi:hypothetical protein
MTNEQYIRKNAQIYERYKDNFDEIPDIDIREFRYEVNQAYFNINKAIDVQFVDGQPYASVEELTMDIRANKRMRISHDHNESRLLPGMHNLYFRAVHDYLHYILQAPFNAEGEIKVYKLQKKCHVSEISKQILFSEVVLQACYCEYFGKFAEFQKVVLYNGQI